MNRSVNRALACSSSVLCLLPAVLGAQPGFVDVTAAVGVEHDYAPEHGTPIGAGVVWEDFDNDGLYDLYAVQGIGCNRLFLNRGSSFAEVPSAAGAPDCDGLGHGATSADYDNDGDADLYLTNAGQNRLFHSLLSETGSLVFIDRTEAAGMLPDGEGNSASGTWADYDGDGDVDLFVVQHAVSVDPPVCWPNLVYRNEGDGTFTEVAAALGLDKSGDLDVAGCGLGVTTSDYDNDGDQDLMVVNDFGFEVAPNRLFRNDGPGVKAGDWRFTDVSFESRFNYSMYGMGIAIGDYNVDGNLDYYMADIGPNDLARGEGDGTFTELAAFAGVEASDIEIYGERGLVSWGPVFADLDHDGLEDLCVANGGAPEELWPGMFGEEYVDLNPNYCYHNLGNGTFEEVHEMLGITYERYYRNVTFVDFDEDGDLDLHFGNLQGHNSFYRNELSGEAINWIQVRARGTIGNADAIGARIKVRSGSRDQMREVDGGSSFMSMSMRTAHFGLGGLDEADELWVRFPSGLTWQDRYVPSNQIIEVREPIYTVAAASGAITVPAGEPFVLDYTVVNQTAAAATVDLWVEFRGPNGDTDLVDGPQAVALDPSGSMALTLEATAPVGTATGNLIFKVGRHPDDVVHMDWVELTTE